MTSRLLLLGTLATVLLAACGPLAGTTASSGLTVSGTGIVRVQPDMVTISLGVSTRNENIAQAVAENNRVAQEILAAAQAAGVAPDDAQTNSFTVYSQSQVDEFGNPTGGQVYVVDNTLTVVLRDPSQLGDLLEAVMGAGANNIYGVNFNVDDPSPAQDQAREKAVDDARSRAEMIASTAGIALGEVTQISTSYYLPWAGPVYSYAAEAAGAGGSGAVPIAPGTFEVQATVTVTYAIR
jgi:uncharacterized protein YggE